MPGAGPFYLATAADGTEVTLRLLHGSWTHDAAARDRFAAEAASATRVPPFCAARILDAGAEDGYAYLVSEYIVGKSLLETISDDGKFGGAQLAALAVGSATGLAAVHQAGLVHGSFGPEHVIMSASGPRIIEFGITPPYGSATPSADMLAWAQTMVFASMGRPPATLADLEVLPEPLRQAVAGCLVGDPALRPTARSVVLDLLDGPEPAAGALAEGSRRAAEATRAVQESQQVRASRSGPGSRSARQSGQRRASDGQRQRRQEQRRQERGGPDLEHAGGPGGVEHATHDHSAGRRRAPSGRRSGALAIAAAVVVIAAVAIVILHVMQNASGPGSASHSGTAQSTTSPVSSTVSAAPPTAPAAFAGSWAGQAKQVNPTDVFNVKLSIPAGSTAGSIEYSSASFKCAGDLSLRSMRHSTLTLSQGIVTGQSTCANGVVTLSTSADGVLQFSFRGKTGPTASGTLTRS